MANVSKITDEQKEQVRIGINRICQLKGISKSSFATQSRISGATLSKIENKKWDDIDDKLWQKLILKIQESSIQLFETADHAAINKMCNVARKNHFMLGLTGDTGMGKTTTLTAYANRRNTYYVVFDKTLSPRQFFSMLLQEMGVSFEGNINLMVNRIADELNEQDSPLLIIDESGKITHTMILYLHVLRDKTNKNCGIILSGMPYFKTNMVKFSNKGKEGMAEFYRRINIWHALQGLSRSEIEYIAKANGIEDEEDIKALKHKTKFGDLINEIILHQTLNEL